MSFCPYTRRNLHIHIHTHPCFQKLHLSRDFILTNTMWELRIRNSPVKRAEPTSQRRVSFTPSQICLSGYLSPSAISVDGNLEHSIEPSQHNPLNLCSHSVSALDHPGATGCREHFKVCLLSQQLPL